MSSLDNAITCCKKSWDGVCQICEQAEFDKAMGDQIETNYVDEAEREYDYEVTI